jgi:hypothetical protein
MDLFKRPNEMATCGLTRTYSLPGRLKSTSDNRITPLLNVFNPPLPTVSGQFKSGQFNQTIVEPQYLVIHL